MMNEKIGKMLAIAMLLIMVFGLIAGLVII